MDKTKLSIKRKIAMITLYVVILLLGFLKKVDFGLLNVTPYYKYDTSFSIYFWLFISVIFLFAIEKEQDFFSFFNLMWILPVFLLLVRFTINYRDVEKFDYLFSQRVNDVKVESFNDSKWRINQFTVNNDTFYFSQNPYWERVYYGKFKVYKSRFKKHYHLKKDE